MSCARPRQYLCGFACLGQGAAALCHMQGFYPVTEGLRFLPGDSLKVTCDFDSSAREDATPAGSGSKVHPLGGTGSVADC